jgi:ATP-dependent Clp protease ATP-binding subunit ClpA
MRVLKFLIVVAAFSYANLSPAGKHRPIYYYFTNGARLAIIDGEVHYMPPSGNLNLKEKIIPIGEEEVLLLPESTSQTSKGSADTVLGKSHDTPLILQTRPAQAAPIMWSEGIKNSHTVTRNHLGIITQDGHFFKFEDAVRSLPDLKGQNIKSFSYEIIGFNEVDFTMIATVGFGQKTIGINDGHPWIISSKGISVVATKRIPLNFTYTYDTQSDILIEAREHSSLLFVDLENPSNFSFESLSDYPDFKKLSKYHPRFAFVDNQNKEWVSESHPRINTLPKDSPFPNENQGSKKSFKKNSNKGGGGGSGIPSINTGNGSMPANKVLAEFARKYEAAEIPDFGYVADDFRSLAIPLFSDTGGSIVVTGESGGGKSTFLEAFARSLLNGEFIDKGVTAEEVEVYHFSASEISSGSKYVGTLESKIEAIVKYAEWGSKNGKRIYFFIDEIHSLVGQGTHSGNHNDVFHSLLTPLSKGYLKIVATTTGDNYTQLAARPDLARRLPQWQLPPVAEKDVPQKIQRWMQAYNKPELSQGLLEYISNVAIEFDSTGEPLSRAARLLERVYAEAAYDGLDFETIESNKDYVLEVASRLYGYNVQNFAIQDLDSRLTQIDESLSHVVGFGEVKERVKNFLIRSVTRSRISDKSDGRLLFISPYGLGKSTTVQSIANALGRPYVRIPLSAYTDREMLYSDIARAALKNPYSLLFFDELGDAPRDIIIALNSTLDDKKIRADINYGKNTGDHNKISVDLSRTFTCAATNSGSTLIEEQSSEVNKSMGFAAEIAKANTQATKIVIDIEKLKKRASEEGLVRSLIDRFEVIPVLYYSQEDFREILKQHFASTIKNVNTKNQKNIMIDDALRESLLDQLMTKHYTPKASPRAAIKELVETIENYFAYEATREIAPKAAEIMKKSCLLLLR